MEGIAQIHEGLAAWRATGAELGRPYFLFCWPRRIAKQDRSRRGDPAGEALSTVQKGGALVGG